MHAGFFSPLVEELQLSPNGVLLYRRVKVATSLQRQYKGAEKERERRRKSRVAHSREAWVKSLAQGH